MKRILSLLLIAGLTACGPSETPKQADVPTVEELAADPARLKDLRQQCKTDRATLGDMLCNRVAEATRKRFYGDGQTLTRRQKRHRSSDRQLFEKFCSSLQTRRSALAPAAFFGFFPA